MIQDWNCNQEGFAVAFNGTSSAYEGSQEAGKWTLECLEEFNKEDLMFHDQDC